MPTYEYECTKCGLHFEKQQSINDEALSVCPECNGKVKRQVSGGSGFIMKTETSSYRNQSKNCSFEETGETCCGKSKRCGKSPCGD